MREHLLLLLIAVIFLAIGFACSEYLPVGLLGGLIGLTGVILGSAIAPLTELLKEQSKAKRQIAAMYAELDDFARESNDTIQKAYSATAAVYKFKIAKLGNRPPLRAVGQIMLPTLVKHYFDIFPNLTANERKAVRTIFLIVESTNAAIKLTHTQLIALEEEYSDFAMVLNNLCVLRYVTKRLIDMSNRYTHPEIDDTAIIDDVLQKLALGSDPFSMLLHVSDFD